jgi:ankyrin repeat protein
MNIDRIINAISKSNFDELYSFHKFDFDYLMRNRSIERLFEYAKRNVITHVIKHSININAVDYMNRNALHLSCLKGMYMASKSLVVRNIDLNCKDVYGNTPLHYAASSGKTMLVSLLLNYEADINSIGYMNYLPIHYACIYNHEDIVYVLMMRDSLVNHQDLYGNTPLHIACQKNYFSIVKMLIQGNKNEKYYDIPKVELNILNYSGFYPIDLTIEESIRNLIQESNNFSQIIISIPDNKKIIYNRIYLSAKVVNPEITVNEVIFRLLNLKDIIDVFIDIGNFDDEIVDVMARRVILQ